MQEHANAIPHWLYTVLQTFAAFGAGGVIVKLITLYQNRKKPIVEVQKVEAETTEITIRSHATAGDSMIRMMNRLDHALNTIDRIRSERDDLRELTDKQGMELESYDRQMKRMKAMLDIRNIKMSDFDDPNS